MTVKSYPMEVLTFHRDGCLATIATNGMRHVSQVLSRCQEHKSLGAAISHLESQGFSIVVDRFNPIY